MAVREFPFQQIYGGEPVPVETGSRTAPGSLSPEGTIPVALPGFNFPPAGSLAVESVNSIQVASGLNAVFIELLAFDLAIAEQFRIWEIGFTAVDPTALVFSEYRVLKNGVPIHGYDAVPVPIGTLDRPGQVALQVAGPARVSVQARCLLPGQGFGHFLVGRVHGWRFNDPRTS